MKRHLLGIMAVAALVLVAPGFALAAMDVWLTNDNVNPPIIFKTKAKITYNLNGATVSASYSLVDNATGFIAIHGGDAENNYIIGFKTIAGNDKIGTDTIGTGTTKKTTTLISTSMSDNMETNFVAERTQLSLGNGLYVMNVGDVNSTYAETKLVVDPVTQAATISITETMTGTLHVLGFGTVPAKVILTTGAKKMPRYGTSWFTTLARGDAPF